MNTSTVRAPEKVKASTKSPNKETRKSFVKTIEPNSLTLTNKVPVANKIIDIKVNPIKLNDLENLSDSLSTTSKGLSPRSRLTKNGFQKNHNDKFNTNVVKTSNVSPTITAASKISPMITVKKTVSSEYNLDFIQCYFALGSFLR